VQELAQQVQQMTGETVEIAFVDRGYTGEQPAQDAADEGIQLEVVKLPQAKKGFVLLPRRWVVERSFTWAGRFRRLARDCDRKRRIFSRFSSCCFCCLDAKTSCRLGIQSA